MEARRMEPAGPPDEKIVCDRYEHPEKWSE
jgi:hypothetical protein